MYSLKEISTGLWLQNNGAYFGEPYFDDSSLSSETTMEKATSDELESIRDAFNSVTPGRTGIFSSPRPH